MEGMDSRTEPTDKVTQSGSDVKIVTIGGKQVEVKYEYRRKRVDIFGLHTGNRRNGNENRRQNKSYSNRFDNRSDGTQNIGRRRQSDDRLINNIIDDNNNSNNSIDSKESSISESVKSMSKVDKLVRKLESSESHNKKVSSIERMAKKLEKERQPVKMSNRFDRLLSSVNTEDFNIGSVKSSAKKNKKKKNKSSVDSLVVKSDNSDESENQIIAQNDSEVMSSDSVPQIVDSNSFSHKSDNLFEANNNLNNYFDKSDDKLIKLNENTEEDERAQHIKVYKNPIHENNNLLINEIIDEKRKSVDSEKSKSSQLYDTPTPKTIVEEKIQTIDTERVNFQKNGSVNEGNNSPNGGLTFRHKSSKDNKIKVKSNHLVTNHQVMNDSNVLIVNQKSSAIKWSLIIVLFVAFLVIYTSLILSRFCDCS